MVGNVYLPGERSGRRPGISFSNPRPGARIFVRDNLGPGREDEALDDWRAVRGDEAWRSREPVLKPSGGTVHPAAAVRELVLRRAGAVVPRRDPVDERLVRSVREGTGRVIDSPREVGGWPELAGGPPPADSDGDGMPDAWEAARGLNPADPRDGAARTRTGLTAVEEYLNGLFPAAAP